METTESPTGPSNSGLTLPPVANSAQPLHRRSVDGELSPRARRLSGEPANSSIKPYSTPEIEGMNTVLYANLTLNEGDTLVYVDVPSLPEDQRMKTTCGGITPASQHFLVHSSNLFALSDSKFPQMLDNAIYQARVKRRRKPTEDQLQGVKYLLDLTPPTEGDDLVFQISELSLTPGIIKYWSAKALFSIDQELVTGHDDVCPCSSDQVSIPIPSPTLEISQDPAKQDDDGISPTFVQNIPQKMISVTIPPSVSDMEILKEKGQDTLMDPPNHYQIPDYCVIRHCHSIIRFMLMIEGVNVNLNSAARVWSMVAISKIFEAPSVIRDQVASWIMSNTTFIEVLPEEAFRIGYRLQLPEITQAAFRILVNELALEEAADGFEPGKPRRQVSVFGRRLGSTDDETVNVIQHAARAFTDRIVKQHHETIAPALLDRLELEEWEKLKTLEQALEQEDESLGFLLLKLRSLMREIQNYVTSNLNSALYRCADWDCSYLDKDRVLYTEPKDFKPLRDILLKFNTTQKLLCPIVSTTIRNDLTSITKDVYFRQEIQSLKRELLLAVARAPYGRDFSSWGPVLERIPDNALMQRPYIVKEPLLNLGKLRSDIVDGLAITKTWDRIKHRFQFALPLTRHMLLTLNDNEMKYLPLWAGGNDDGTGGVFEDFLPPAEMGPNGPGPAYHTGQTLLSETSSVSGSLMDELEAIDIAGSSVARSVDVQDGTSTVYRPDRVIALGSSIASESFYDGASEFDRAVWAAPAAHQDVPGLDDVDISVPGDDDSGSDATITSFGDDFDDDLDDNFDGDI
ncbi:unnamed protein product [Clonostachys byssicola]|uniref:Uncharacterized protein n=1 Tax=Clonostachys byssicola TaxID=160290 RepID=A0A9N9Y5D4_9HYPO|nr:unnamed protein product [Clonostachys byssicola]